MNATILLIIGVIIFLITLFRKDNKSILKIASVFILISFTILANNIWVYLSAIFIISTMITELKFLLDLAAIIRGDKGYFDQRGSKIVEPEPDEPEPDEPPPDELDEEIMGQRSAIQYKILNTLWTK